MNRITIEQLQNDSYKKEIQFVEEIKPKEFSIEETSNTNSIINDFKSEEKEKSKIRIYRHFGEDEEYDMYYVCLNTYAIFDDLELLERITNYIKTIPLQDAEQISDSEFQTTFVETHFNNKPYRIPLNIIVPSQLNQQTAGHLFANQIAQILKNANINEQKTYLTHEYVIPMFMELLSAHLSDEDTKAVFKSRRNIIIETINKYRTIEKLYRESTKEDLKKFIKLKLIKTGTYLNSFYHALSLLNIYLQNPKKVLELTHKVLNCELTTIEMIEELQKDYNENLNYNEGIQKFKLTAK